MRVVIFSCGIALALLCSPSLWAQGTQPEETKREQGKSGEKKPAEKKPAEKSPAKPSWTPYSVIQQYKIIAAIDEDLDGTMSAKEIETALERIEKLDVDGDGKLSSEEFLIKGKVPNHVASFGVVKALDADKDNVLNADEIKNAVDALKELDANKNKKLEPIEYAMRSPMSMGGGGGGGGRGGGRATPTPEAFMKQNDKNMDGKIEKSELTGPAANAFDRMDENKDGAVTLEEVKSSRERMRQQNGTGSGRGGQGGAPAPGSGANPEKASDAPKGESPQGSQP